MIKLVFFKNNYFFIFSFSFYTFYPLYLLNKSFLLVYTTKSKQMVLFMLNEWGNFLMKLMYNVDIIFK